MTEQEKRELNERVARRAGFTWKFGGRWRYEQYKETNCWWEAPNGHKFKDCPSFISSLDVCFHPERGIVPKLIQQLDNGTVKIELKYGRTKEMNWTFLFDDWEVDSFHFARDENPALALCKAVDQLPAEQ